MTPLHLKLRCRGDEGFVLSVDVALPGSGITAIYGPSGSGKSTLLDCIAGLRDAEAGSRVKINGVQWGADAGATPAWRRDVGYVFQDARLFNHLTVAGNLEYAIKRRKHSAGPSLEAVAATLELEALLPRKPGTLSAGQRQRVAIARALLRNPALLLMDEPLANLDHAAKHLMLHALQQIAAQTNIPILYVSHDIEEVSQLADYLVLIEEGEITQHGPALELSSRLDTRLSHEEQAAAIVTGRVSSHDSAFALTQITTEQRVIQVAQLNLPVNQPVRVRIPARDVSLCRTRPRGSSILNILAVTVAEIERTQSPRLLLRLTLGSQFLLARITRKSLVELNIRVGDELYAQIKSVALLHETGTMPETQTTSPANRL